MKVPQKLARINLLILAALVTLFSSCEQVAQTAVASERSDTPSGDTVFVDMVAFDQPIMFNRLGAALPTGMIFALKRDIVAKTGNTLSAGNVKLRDDKRPRPIVLRANVGDVIQINFTNYLEAYNATADVDAYNTDRPAPVSQSEANTVLPKTRMAGVHIEGVGALGSVNSDASWVGDNDNSLASPGETKTYTIYAAEEGAFMIYSAADILDNAPIRAAQLSNGLFGTLAVQPKGAEWYRSQVSEADLKLATTGWKNPSNNKTLSNKDVAKNGLYSKKVDGYFPLIDYAATFTNGDPILQMYKQLRPNARELIYTDLTAIITGPDAGEFPVSDDVYPSFFKVPATPNRRQPYREFAIHYHEAPYVVQSFPVFYNAGGASGINDISGTLQAGVDRFAINYGTGGIGAEIYANRIQIGPMADCSDCAYEEFFLSSWTVGDPATVVDIPANAIAATQVSVDSSLQNQFLWNQADANAVNVLPGTYGAKKATKVVYPDDPSNVYHSYMNDHVKFRVTHAGGGVTHVHHQHAHQWLHSPNNDNGHYLDSQVINPGSSYTLEIAYDGSGNLNKTVGDQIFHCHFYPHFAQGMWSMWRVHDVLELGTEVDANKLPVTDARALPDGEIAAGTAIPGIVPMPTKAMAPMPSKIHIEDGQIVVDDDTKNPGYPFFIPGVAGSRAPHPPLDFAEGTIYGDNGDSIGFGALNGGLPRGVVVKGSVPFENHTIYDWTKVTDSLHMVELPEGGTAIELVAMNTHSVRNHNTMKPDGTSGDFILNGLPAQPGAPYADPAIDLEGNSVGTKRVYKAANIQVDAVFNKKGWHYPQQRIISLWGDVAANVDGTRPPEPFFFRANSREYIEFWHTNLVPEYYELDDFQVRTPTDIIGQHIHLVKFDVTSSDGAANGWNYEDGTFATDMVRDRIEAINNGGKRYTYKYTPGKPLNEVSNYTVDTEALAPHAPNPVWGKAPEGQNWYGAQTTIQRWYSDPLLNNKKEDRTLRTVFTHDHFGPSTHQQAGLYAGLLIEPYKSLWLDPVTGDTMGIANGKSRTVNIAGTPMQVSDGGPTSWQANIVTNDQDSSYREFMLEFQDSQLAYTEDSRGTPDPYPHYPTNPTAAQHQAFVDSANAYRGWMDLSYAINPPTSTVDPTGFAPQLVSNGIIGTYSMNYRAEPIPMRVADANNNQASGKAGNLAYAFSSDVTRANPVFNSQPTGGASISDSNNFKFPVDPLSPGMQGGDPYTPLFRAYSDDKIQVRTLVGAHILSHFFNINGANWYFEPSAENSGFRSTQNMGLSEHFEMNFKLPETASEEPETDYLYRASSDASGMQAGLWGIMRAYNGEQEDLVSLPNNPQGSSSLESTPKCGCPENATVRTYNVTAISIDKYWNANTNGGQLIYNEKYNNLDPTAIVYVRDEDLDKFKTMQGWQVEPLVLRASAGECVKVNLKNEISSLFQTNTSVYAYNANNSVTLAAPSEVGLHNDLLSYDVSKYDGTNVGFNSTDQTAGIGDSISYEWYAGTWQIMGFDTVPIPVEFGTTILASPDPMEQYLAGLFGSLIIEPEGSHWEEDEYSRSSANVYDSSNNLLFREFVLHVQDNLAVSSMPKGNNPAFAQVTTAFNYKSEPMASRFNNQTNFNLIDVADATSNTLNGGEYPETPHFVAVAGTPVRIRLSHPGGNNNEIFNLHGHVWQEEPYIEKSTKIGYNDMSQWFGFRDQLGALNSFDLVIESAGGHGKTPGDYLYNSMSSSTFVSGLWGVFTVTEDNDKVMVYDVDSLSGGYTVKGYCSVDPTSGKRAATVTMKIGDASTNADVDPLSGDFEFTGVSNSIASSGATITSSNGGTTTVSPQESGNMIESDKNYKAPTIMKYKDVPADPNQNPGMRPPRKLGPKKQIHTSTSSTN